ncbi:MAG: hypothetical protein R3F02_15865 [Thiolinea sp.]
MFTKTSTILITSLILLSGCVAESAPAPWQISQTGTNNIYQAHLDCETQPETGPFQNCTVSFTDLQGVNITPETILIDGGMPLHGHGLPTSPVLTTLEQTGTYRIDGLKYNMPGAWLLGFKVSTSQNDDKIIFDFVI